jgi:hypothetical protein
MYDNKFLKIFINKEQINSYHLKICPQCLTIHFLK